MTNIEIAGQIISIAAMATTIFSYQQKKQLHLVICQLIGGTLFAVSFFLLGATVGALLNLVASIRAVLFLFSKKLHATHPAWLYGFIACYIVLYVLAFTAFGVEPTVINMIVELLPVIGMTALSIGFMREDSAAVRRWGFVSSPAWLVYNIYYLSIGAIICETISIVSIIVGVLRHDRKKSTDNPTENTQQ